MTDHILFSYALAGPLAGQALTGDAIASQIECDDLAWVHLDAAHPKSRDWILRNLPYLDRHAIDALLAEETRPRATEIGDGMLIILRSVNLDQGSEPEDMVSLRLWIDPHRIVSLRRRRVDAITEIGDRIHDGQIPATAGDFLALLVDRLTERIEPVLRRLDDEADELEEVVIDGPNPGLRRPIAEIRRRTIHFRRFIAPQREAVGLVRASILPWISDMNHRRLAEAQDRLTRTIEELDAIRERAQVVKDDLANALADRMNRNMYVLSVIAAVFLPLGFLTGLLGVNLAGIPGSDRLIAFPVFAGLLVVIVVLQVMIFRRLRWF